MSTQPNPLLCDPSAGFCTIPDSSSMTDLPTSSTEKPIQVIYFTDPICSSCWGIEPQLRKLKLEYGENLKIDYHMGGLLPDWSYNSGGISQPSDVAHHWDEASHYYDMPIDGDIWLEDPLNSSFPASIAFKAAQMQNNDLAVHFLRSVREMLFLRKINISRLENLLLAVKEVGLDADQFLKDWNGPAQRLFEEDLKITKKYGVRGFPTMFFADAHGNREMVYGSKPYEAYESAVLKLLPTASRNAYAQNWESLFTHFSSLTALEFSVLSGNNRSQSERLLNQLVESGRLQKLTTRNGSLWFVKLS